jgi:hypothetical protein
MKDINFLLEGLGFKNYIDFKVSTFGFITFHLIKLSALLAFIETIFGVDWVFLIAYSVLIGLEWWSGVQASYSKGEKHESKKLGRMLFKLAVYSSILFVLNTFERRVQFPVIFNYEIDPFSWLYWTALIVIIWQLLVSLLENLEVLKFPFAGKLLRIINNKFYKQFELDNEDNSSK